MADLGRIIARAKALDKQRRDLLMAMLKRASQIN
jgi:hypothetical protein